MRVVRFGSPTAWAGSIGAVLVGTFAVGPIVGQSVDPPVEPSVDPSVGLAAGFGHDSVV